MHKYWSWFLNSLFPKKCVICRTPGCVLCSKHLVQKRHNNSIKLSNTNLELFVYADYHQQNNAKIMHYFKYYGFKDLAEIMTQDFAKILPKSIKKLDNLFVIPVPIHWTRFLWRGFNQAQILASKFSKKNKKFELHDNNLIKYKKTKTQVKLNRKARLKNIKNVFKLKNPAKIKDKTILLIDDVITTGSTLKEIENLLLKAGAKKVYALTYLIREK